MSEPLSEAQMAVVNHGLVDHPPADDVEIFIGERDKPSYYAMRDITEEASEHPLTLTSQGYCVAYRYVPPPEDHAKWAGMWFAVRITHGGGSGSTALPNQQAAEDQLRRDVAGTRAHWDRYVVRAAVGTTDKGERIIRCDGQHYVVGKAYRGDGFGGSRWLFEMLDTGEVIDTRNLWSQGRIPNDYRDRLPDNAKLLPVPPRAERREG